MTDRTLQDIPKECDVAIIGGGPTGSSAANRLASEGFHVVLLDRVTHPRNTVGESLIPHFWRYAEQLGAKKAVQDEGFIAKSGGLALWGNEMRRLRFREFGYDLPALHVERDAFDNILLRVAQDAGAQVFEGVTVKEVSGLEDPVTTVEYMTPDGERNQLRARYIVDASGQAAVIAQQLKIRLFDEALKFSAFWGYYKKSRYLTYDGGVYDDEEKFKHPPATLISSIGDWGWTWHIVMRKSVSVGIILPRSRLSELRARTEEEREELFRRQIANVPLTGRLLDEDDFVPGSLLSMRNYAYRPVALTVGNCYLAGDAAAFVDPINSLGVVFGMFSGMLAAHGVARSLNNPSEAQLNRDLYTSQYGNRVALFRLLALPEGADFLSAEEIARAKSAIGASSESELELMALQACVNVREGVLQKVFDDVGVSVQPKIESIDWRALPI